MRRELFLSLLALAALTVAISALASGGPLEGNVEALRVTQLDNGRESFSPASEVRPSDVIEYRLTYVNKGDVPLARIAITDPIPVGTQYVTSSASRPQTGSVLFSIDNGRSFHPWPIMIKKVTPNGDEVWLEANAAMVSHIRWTLPEEFEPQGAVTLTYRAVVN